jgi:uncharacterized protein (DUF4415 family)
MTKANPEELSVRDRQQAGRDLHMKKDNRKPLTKKLQMELDALAAMPESEIDTSEMPEITNWSEGVRSALFRPIKKPLSLRIDADIIDWFQKQGTGYQTRMNTALREYVKQHQGHA